MNIFVKFARVVFNIRVNSLAERFFRRARIITSGASLKRIADGSMMRLHMANILRRYTTVVDEVMHVGITMLMQPRDDYFVFHKKKQFYKLLQEIFTLDIFPLERNTNKDLTSAKMTDKNDIFLIIVIQARTILALICNRRNRRKSL